jgi:uroporphyrinogen-III synthase/uroporphyrinogen III methyltransferase/synthase
VSVPPLLGRRILVTRAAHQAGKLSDGLRALGADPVEVPVLEFHPPTSLSALDAALRQFASYDWLVLTSGNAVHALVGRAAALGISLAQPAWLSVAAVGEATAAEARKAGFKIAFVPETYVAESLVEGLTKSLQKQSSARRILLARAVVARDVIPEALRLAGAAVDVVDAYQNILPKAAPEQMRSAVRSGIDAVTFTSSSSATHLAEAARAANVAWPIALVPAVSIGPVTSQTLRDLGWPPAAEADPSDIPGLIAAVVRVLRREMI